MLGRCRLINQLHEFKNLRAVTLYSTSYQVALTDSCSKISCLRYFSSQKAQSQTVSIVERTPTNISPSSNSLNQPFPNKYEDHQDSVLDNVAERTSSNPIAEPSINSSEPGLSIDQTVNEWNPNQFVGGILADFPDLSDEFLPGSHPAEILAQCRLSSWSGRLEKLTSFVDNYFPVDVVFALLSFLKLQFGLSWGGAVVASSLLIRTLLIPITLAAEKARRRNALHAPASRDYAKQLEMIRKNQLPGVTFQDAQRKYSEYRRKHGLPWVPTSLILQVAIQAPLLISFWRCIYRIASFPEDYREFAMEAPLWFDSLALADSLLLLPLIYCAVLFLNAEILTASDRTIQLKTVMTKGHKIPKCHEQWYERSLLMGKTTRLGIAMSLIVVAKFPVGLLLYITTNQICQILVSAVARLRTVEKTLDLIPSELWLTRNLVALWSKFVKRFPSLNFLANVLIVTRVVLWNGVSIGILAISQILEKHNLKIPPTIQTTLGNYSSMMKISSTAVSPSWNSLTLQQKRKKSKKIEFVNKYQSKPI